MDIQLERPLIFFDLETTGINFQKDKIIEICAKKFNLDGTTTSLYYLLDPEIPIDEAATAKHGYTLDMLTGKPKFGEVAKDIYNFFVGCDYGGYNAAKFDIPFLFQELTRFRFRLTDIYKCNVMDPYKIVNKMEPRTLEHYYESIFGERYEKAHSAEGDIDATIRIFEYQIKKYNLRSVSEISDISRTDKDGSILLDYTGLFKQKSDGKIYYGIGKNKDCYIYDDMDYLKWICLESNFDENVKYLAFGLYNKRMNTVKN